MNQPSGALYEIRWNEVCPSLVLVRALRVSVMVRVLMLAMAGVVLTQWGWSLVDGIFATAAPQLSHLDQPSTSTMQSGEFGDIDWGGPLARAWAWLNEPFIRTARSATDRGAAGWKYSAALGLCGLWAIIIWALFGGAIARIAALHLTRLETPGPWAAMKDAAQKWTASAGAPLIPLVGSLLLAIPLMLTGIMLRTDYLSFIVGLLWIFVILWGFLLAVLLIGLLVGWPLMWATIGVERTDAFDGVSRCYAYVYQRPMHLVCYVAFACALGWLGQIAVEYFAMAAGILGEWAVSWGAGGQRIADLTATEGNTLTGMAAIGASGIRFWKEALQTLVASYALAYLWSAAVGIYLLLRRQVDSTEMDEVVIEESTEGLPQLEDDLSGVPSMQSEPTTTGHDENKSTD